MIRSKLAFSSEGLMKRLVLIVGMGVAALLINGHLRIWTVTGERAAISSASAPVVADQRREVEVVTITPDGFEPQQIMRTAGPFLLSVTNRSGVDSLNIRLETEQHGRFREKLLPLQTPYWREVINPPPGRYIVTEVNHPEWVLSITIQ
jgi:hypothetical protein